jgi:hypothetical protein
MGIAEYCGAAVSDPALVINTLRGLNNKFSQAIAVLSTMNPPPTFLYTKSYLLQEEHRIRHSQQMEAQTALIAAATTTTPPKNVAASQSASQPPAAGNTDHRKKRKSSDGRNRSNNSGSGHGAPTGGHLAQWACTPNPWQGVVQAWPMNAWRPSVLGSRPGVHLPTAAPTSAPPPDAAFYAGHSAQLPAGIYSALNNMSLNNSGGGGNTDWFLDTGATAHMGANAGILTSPSLATVPRHIVVGNGQSLPATCTGHTSIPTSSSSLQLQNILIAPQLVKNLISVRALTRDNSVSVEFDPWGFSIKDLRTRTVLLRCDSSGDLYPLRHSITTSAPSPTALHASHDSAL